MTDSELKEYIEEFSKIYKGILFNNPSFASGSTETIVYEFDCSQFELLKEKYNLIDIAKEGTEFEKAVRLLCYFAPKITHKGDFINKIGCNAIDLLDYSFKKPNNGINCVNKSKILQECCLALGIYARRVWLMPYSPYDMDNHVCTEIFDRTLDKWIMLDMTFNAYFVDENNDPLSVLEIREKLVSNKFCRFAKKASEPSEFFTDLETEALYCRQYYAKNLFYLYVESNNCYGNKNKHFAFVPNNFNVIEYLKVKGLFSANDTPLICDIETLARKPI